MRRILVVAALAVLVICGCDGDGYHSIPYCSSRLSVQNPAAMIVSGDLEITFELSCPIPRKSGIGVFFSTNAGSTWSSATVKNPSGGTLQGNLITSLLAPTSPAAYTFTWDSVTDVGHEYVQDVQLLLYIEELYPDDWQWDVAHIPFYNYGSAAAATKVFTVNNDRAPVVSVTTPGSPQTGDVLVEFSLVDEDFDLCRVTVEYSRDNGLSYFAATLKDVMSNPMSGNILFGLDGTDTPKLYAFVWDSAIDLNSQYNEEVKLKLVANDGVEDSAPSETGAFTVSNNDAPIVTIEDIGGMQVGDVMVAFTVSDPDSPVVALDFQYSVDGGATWQPAAVKYTSVGTVAGGLVIITDASGVETSGLCVWDSLADGVATGALETNVQLSVFGQDEHRPGPVDSTRSFVVDNTTAGSWGPLVTLSDPASPVSSPACALDPLDNPVVAWVDSTGGIPQIYFSEYDGASWSTPAAATVSVTGAAEPCIAVTTDGNIHLVYVESGQVLYTYYDGASWLAPLQLSSASAGEPDLAADSTDTLHVVWKELTGGCYIIHYCPVSGGTPGPVELVNDGALNSESPAVACISTTPYVVWSEAPLGVWEILSARRTGPGTWESLGVVSNTPGASRRPCIASCQGTSEVAAAWMDDTPGTNFDVYINVFSGGAWQVPANISANGGNSVNPSISYRGSVPQVVWSDNSNLAQNYQIAFSSYPSGSSSPPVLISNTSGEAAMPVIVSGVSGCDVLLWQEITATGTVVLCRVR